jgi:CheY-like chemotaxis protein
MAKILVVEDQDNIRKLIRMNLERVGHEVCEADSKESGLATAQDEGPDLIVLDVMMPKGTEGFQFVWELRNNADAPLKDVPIVMMTGIHDHTELRFYPESEDGTYKAGEYLPVQAFLDKPVDPEKLIETVNKYLS